MELNDLIKEIDTQAQQDRLKAISNFITGKRVLDVGAGAGQLKKHIPEDKQYVAVDGEEAFVDYMTSIGLNAIQANINNLPFEDQSFDTVIAGEIIEHLENPGKGLAECMRVAKNQIIITLPNNNGWLEHSWTFEWSLLAGWIIMSIKRNPHFQREHQEKFKL